MKYAELADDGTKERPLLLLRVGMCVTRLMGVGEGGKTKQQQKKKKRQKIRKSSFYKNH